MLISIILTFYFHISRSLYIPISTAETSAVQNASETQHAVCNIFTKEVAASANATITRELKGVCTSDQLTDLVNQLQSGILKELNEIKNILDEYKLPKRLNDHDYDYSEKSKVGSKETKNLDIEPLRSVVEEIEKYNDSISDTPAGETFMYYWRIENIQGLFNKFNMYISSPSMVVLGYSLHLQFYPHHLGSDNVGIQLRPESYSFIKKHKIFILDQLGSENIPSEILGKITNKPEMFINPLTNLNEEKYSYKNCMIIKVEIYLNS